MFTEKYYKRFSGLTVVGVLLLFFMGGLVRTTGAGMGCPDWPKCFEQWAPPLSEASLPDGYEQIYVEKRKAKIERLTELLTILGMQKQATAIQNDPYLLQPHPYNRVKAYTEYTNRVVGVLTGIFAVLALVSALQFRKSSPGRLFLTLGGVIWIAVNGWLGSLVVDTNLLEGMVTIHFVAAFLALAFMQIAYKMPLTKINLSIKKLGRVRWLSVLFFVFLCLQILSGTQVREVTDNIIRSSGSPADWFQTSSGLWMAKFVIHRYLPIVSGVLLFLLYMLLRNQQLTENQRVTFRHMVSIYLLQGLAGAMILWIGNNSFIQLIHVTLGGLIFALALNWIIEVNRLKAA